jgi:hypothetical protein
MQDEISQSEIEAVADRMLRRGEYSDSLSEAAERESEKVGLLLLAAADLTDDEAEGLVASSADALEPEPAPEQLRAEVQSALHIVAESRL